jgi:hypothetical protein
VEENNFLPTKSLQPTALINMDSAYFTQRERQTSGEDFTGRIVRGIRKNNSVPLITLSAGQVKRDREYIAVYNYVIDLGRV